MALIQAIADAAQDAGMITCLETILTGAELIRLLELIDRAHVAVVYDTGNRVAFGHGLAGDIGSDFTESFGPKRGALSWSSHTDRVMPAAARAAPASTGR
mgnify:CR=1 FL=1